MKKRWINLSHQIVKFTEEETNLFMSNSFLKSTVHTWRAWIIVLKTMPLNLSHVKQFVPKTKLPTDSNEQQTVIFLRTRYTVIILFGFFSLFSSLLCIFCKFCHRLFLFYLCLIHMTIVYKLYWAARLMINVHVRLWKWCWRMMATKYFMQYPKFAGKEFKCTII